jgi:type II pantothenate kinase
MLPLCRALAQQATHVVLAANELPTLNDMTAEDVRRLWPALVDAEPSLAALPISAVSTGTAEPLIDLSRVSRELNEAAADADLVILEGMGRALESNYNAAFNCDALKLAMIKDAFVARWLGGALYDVVCRFEPCS